MLVTVKLILFAFLSVIVLGEYTNKPNSLNGKSVKEMGASYVFDRQYSATLDPHAKAGQFKLLKELGKGSFGKVSLVEHNETGEQLAMKDVEVIDCDWDKLDRELKIMLAADSPNLSSKFLAKVRYYYWDKKRYTEKDSSVAVAPLVVNGKAVAGAGSGISNADKPKKVEKCFAHIAMEYFPPRDLTYMLNYTCDLYKRPQALQFIAANMVLAIEYIHSQGIIHRDIKPDNFLVNFPDGYLRMTDFGLSNIQSQACVFKGICGSPLYIAPEIFQNNGKEYSKAADWWSLGVTLYKMATCHFFFDANNLQTLWNNVLRQPILMPSFLPPMFADLITNLLNRDPKDRLGANGASDVKAHHFFFGFNWKQLQKQEMEAPIVPKYDGNGALYYRDTVANEDLNLLPGATA